MNAHIDDQLECWLVGNIACWDGRRWAATLADRTPAGVVKACHNGAWLLWVAEQLRYPHAALIAAVRPAVLRALREYTPVVCDDAGYSFGGNLLRGLSADVDLNLAAQVAYDLGVNLGHRGAGQVTRCAEYAADAARYIAPGRGRPQPSRAARAVADCARVLCPHAEGIEHAQCANEVRAALPDLAERLARAIAKGRLPA